MIDDGNDDGGVDVSLLLKLFKINFRTRSKQLLQSLNRPLPAVLLLLLEELQCTIVCMQFVDLNSRIFTIRLFQSLQWLVVSAKKHARLSA
jgi:hypothetical protein